MSTRYVLRTGEIIVVQFMHNTLTMHEVVD